MVYTGRIILGIRVRPLKIRRRGYNSGRVDSPSGKVVLTEKDISTSRKVVKLRNSKTLSIIDPVLFREIEKASDDIDIEFGVQPIDQIELEEKDTSFQKIFSADHLFEGESQEKVMEAIGKPAVENVFKGYNSSIWAYGQTGSGKTYTMLGTAGSCDLISIRQEGLVQRIGRQIFHDVELLKTDNELISFDRQFRIHCSCYEIYNEKIRDLLASNSKSKSSKSMKVREHPVHGVYVEKLSKHLVTKYDDLRKLLVKSSEARTVGATQMNRLSSRSHTIFTIYVAQDIEESATHSAERIRKDISMKREGKINLIDLAGSERTQNASGMRLREALYINKSLSTLGDVIHTLTSQSKGRRGDNFVPYRNSVLTWLMKDSFGGNSLTTMIGTISQSEYHFQESLSTLRFVQRTKHIINKAVVNESGGEEAILELQNEVLHLKQELAKERKMSKRQTQEEMEELKIIKKDARSQQKEMQGIIDRKSNEIQQLTEKFKMATRSLTDANDVNTFLAMALSEAKQTIENLQNDYDYETERLRGVYGQAVEQLSSVRRELVEKKRLDMSPNELLSLKEQLNSLKTELTTTQIEFQSMIDSMKKTFEMGSLHFKNQKRHSESG